MLAKIELIKTSPLFQQQDTSKVVILATYDQLGVAKTIGKDQRGMFDRIILDEAHAIRRLEATRRGRVLATLDAEFRWSFTATIIYNSLEDISGFLAFHQRAEWAADNGAADERLMEFVNGLIEQSGVSNDDAMSIAPNDSEMSSDNVTDNNDAMSATLNDAEMSPGNVTDNNDAMFVALNDTEMLPDNVAGFVTKLEHLDNRSDSHTLEDDTDMSDPDDDAESWAECCLSELDLNVSERMDKINEGWLCTHFPALLALNSGRPASINEKKRENVNKKPIPRPFVTNPYDLYHAMNPNSPRCATTAAFDYWVRPHLPNRHSEGNEKKIEWRIGCILRQLVICRNTSSVIFCRSGEVQCGKTLPPMTIWTQDLCLKPDEQAAYDAKEGTCSIDMLVNLTQTHLTPDEEQGVSQTRKQGPVLAAWGAVQKAQEDLGTKDLSGTQLASRALGLSYERLRDRSFRAFMDSQYS
ncbi:hypothetical protein GP486_006876 [Trichoglossum hirsutum]|uniref:SNF2 N-terminal domain-containing protein n=1 Tax=Trichoglossum hirsutum TaxID=265104 RepID=A0A9P8IGC5_9PEZI|nr:hypothetical protein GP486_006876 [Trichoglossum hirsutum]